MLWHVHVASLSVGGLPLEVKSGFTGYVLRTGVICRPRKSHPNQSVERHKCYGLCNGGVKESEYKRLERLN